MANNEVDEQLLVYLERPTEISFQEMTSEFEGIRVARANAFAAVEGKIGDWRGSWRSTDGGASYSISLSRSDGAKFTARAVDIRDGFAHTPDGVVPAFSATRVEASDGNNGTYHLVWDPNAPRPLRVWYGRFLGAVFGEGSIGLSERDG